MVVVTTASMMPSGISAAPAASSRGWPGWSSGWPTLRTNSSERPCSSHVLAARAGVAAVGLRPRVKVLPPLLTIGERALMMPSQLP